MKKCEKCAKFPFCKENPETCNKFKKRKYEMKLIATDGISFKFERVD